MHQKAHWSKLQHTCTCTEDGGGFRGVSVVSIETLFVPDCLVIGSKI